MLAFIELQRCYNHSKWKYKNCNSKIQISSFFFFFVFSPFPVDLPEAEKLALSLCCQIDRPSAWRTIFFECLSSGKHFLEQVLVRCQKGIHFFIKKKKDDVNLIRKRTWWNSAMQRRSVSVLKVTGLDLMKHEEYDGLKDLLRLEFRPLSRLLLLLGWSQCRGLDAAQALVNVLHKEQVKTSATHLFIRPLYSAPPFRSGIR